MRYYTEDEGLYLYGLTPSSDGAAGLDLEVSEDVTIYPNDKAMVGTSLFVEIDLGWCGLIIPRSSMGKKNIMLSNTVGLIDSDYRGEIKLMLSNTGKDTVSFGTGERVAQMILVPHYDYSNMKQVSHLRELSDTTRGTGGFGHTGRTTKLKSVI